MSPRLAVAGGLRISFSVLSTAELIALENIWMLLCSASCSFVLALSYFAFFDIANMLPTQMQSGKEPRGEVKVHQLITAYGTCEVKVQ